MNNVDVLEGDVSDEAMEEGAELRAAAENAKIAEEEARRELWSAKYDTMTSDELQAVVDDIKDEAEKEYAMEQQRDRVTTALQEDLETFSAVGDPESDLYDPNFSEKIDAVSTALDEGDLGEMNTGYADINYEFINGNADISEYLVGKEKNYYYITDEEKELYNYWYNYDLEKGTNKKAAFLALIQEVLNGRHSDQEFSENEGKYLKEIFYGVKSGWNQYKNETNNGFLLPDGYIPKTSTEMTAEKIREDLGNAWDSLTINGSTVPQHMFDWLEDVSYAVAEKYPTLITLPFGGLPQMAMESLFSGLAARGREYRDRTSRGYTQEEARSYANSVGVGTAVRDAISGLIKGVPKELFEKAFSDEDVYTVGKLLTSEDWLGIADTIQSFVKNGSWKAVTGEDNPTEEELRATAQSAVTAKALDKIFNRMKASPEDVSLDLRQSLLQSLKDPNVRKKLEESGSFTQEQTEKIIAGLESAGDTDEGIGTYVGDVLYGENGYAVSRQFLQQQVDEALRNRNAYYDEPTGRALYERYMPKRR